MQIIYQKSLFGNMSTRDSKKIIDILKYLTLGTDAKTWFKVIKCGIKNIQELQSHYYCMSEGTLIKSTERNIPQ